METVSPLSNVGVRWTVTTFAAQNAASVLGGTTRRRRGPRLSGLVRRGRELPALGLLALWVFGVVVAPLVHLSLHGGLAPHTHETAAAEAASCHDDHCHDAPAASDVEQDDDESPADHGRGSQLHGELAALFPAPALVIPPFVAIGERAEPGALGDVVDALAPPPLIARGPPTTT